VRTPAPAQSDARKVASETGREFSLALYRSDLQRAGSALRQIDLVFRARLLGVLFERQSDQPVD
jgi:hypothetical protein